MRLDIESIVTKYFNLFFESDPGGDTILKNHLEFKSMRNILSNSSRDDGRSDPVKSFRGAYHPRLLIVGDV